jgi:hypothetical protein
MHSQSLRTSPMSYTEKPRRRNGSIHDWQGTRYPVKTLRSRHRKLEVGTENPLNCYRPISFTGSRSRSTYFVHHTVFNWNEIAVGTRLDSLADTPTKRETPLTSSEKNFPQSTVFLALT